MQQFRIYRNGAQPITFLNCATVSDEAKARFDSGDKSMAVNEWRSGTSIVIVHCVSPFADRADVEEQFWKAYRNNRAQPKRRLIYCYVYARVKSHDRL